MYGALHRRTLPAVMNRQQNRHKAGRNPLNPLKSQAAAKEGLSCTTTRIFHYGLLLESTRFPRAGAFFYTVLLQPARGPLLGANVPRYS